jgi:DNA-binding GntR family transcriptional regulator
LSDGPVAPYRQLARLLADGIADGTYPPGSRLPSLTTLAQEHGIATSTVQKALNLLKADGLIVTSVMGTFVA